jgi:DNA-binding beta-propeller fold protein YncE
MVTGKRVCVVIAVVTSLALPAVAAADPGDIAFESCLSNSGTEGCADLPFDPLNFATGVAVSPDGKSVYVVSEASNSIAHFFRDRTTGALAYDGCLDNTGANGCGDLPGAPIEQASGVAVSPDGKSVYVTGWGSNTVAHFFRNGPDGQIGYDGCVGNDNQLGCADMPGSPLSGPRGVAVSPDGKSVYVASYGNGTVLHLLRSGPDGQIVFQGCLDNSGFQSCLDVPGSPFSGARSVAVSPDGKSVYVASAISNTVSHLVRNGTTGAITWEGCLGDGTAGGACAVLPGGPMFGAQSVAVSPDGKSVYASGATSVLHFFRNGSAGQLGYDGCLNNDGLQNCVDVPGTPFGSVWSIAASADGRSVYSVSMSRQSIAHMLRSGPDGQIAFDGCLASTTANGCGDIPFAPLNAPGGIAVSPDGKSVYVVTTQGDSIAHFSREPVPPPPGTGGGPAPSPGPGAPGPSADTLAPVVSELAVKRARTLRYTLSETATVRVNLERARPGRRYRRLSPALSGAGAAGPNRLGFSRRLRRQLAPGTYRATVTATDTAGNRSSASRVRFRVRG